MTLKCIVGLLCHCIATSYYDNTVLTNNNIKKKGLRILIQNAISKVYQSFSITCPMVING